MLSMGCLICDCKNVKEKKMFVQIGLTRIRKVDERR